MTDQPTPASAPDSRTAASQPTIPYSNDDQPTPHPAERQPIVDTLPLPGRDVVLELRVRNHPGVMSHVTGLFARRAFNLEAVLCVPETDRSLSRMLLLVVDEPQLEQMERQLAKLHDVLEVRHRPDLDAAYFAAIQW